MVTITAYDSGGNAITELYQWDIGITVYLTSTLITDDMYVHFANHKSGTAYVVSGTYSDGYLSVTIPGILLESPYTIYGYVYATSGDTGQTILFFSIEVIKRAKPSDYVDVDSANYISVTSALSEIAEMLDRAEEAATAATTSESNAASSATLAESWAVGGTGSRDGEDEDNAKYYAEIAANNAADALGFYFDTDGYLYGTDDEEE